MKKNLYIYMFLLCFLVSCNTGKNNPKNDAEKVALKFSEAYFNHDYNKAMKHVTDDSKKWLQYAASNMTQEDVDLLRSMEESATVVVDSSREGSNAIVYITVNNYMMKDSIGKVGHIVKTGHFHLNVINNGTWKVDLESCI